jgi:RNA polymerase sigma factor (sigma-70 family)
MTSAVARDQSRHLAWSSDLIGSYLAEIGRHPLLSKEDEVRLARVIEDGKRARAELGGEAAALTPARRRRLGARTKAGEDARREFVQGNLRLVVSIAKRYRTSAVPLLDLIQEGNIGLIQAVERFDWRRGFKFSTLASWWIRRAITRAIANTSRTIRLPIHAGEDLAMVKQAQIRLESEIGRPPSGVELGADVELPEGKLARILRFSAEPVSLDGPIGVDNDHNLAEIVEDLEARDPEGEVIGRAVRHELERLLATLAPREREIIRLHYGLEGAQRQTMAQVAAGVGLSTTRARQIKARVLDHLRRQLETFAG